MVFLVEIMCNILGELVLAYVFQGIWFVKFICELSQVFPYCRFKVFRNYADIPVSFLIMVICVFSLFFVSLN